MRGSVGRNIKVWEVSWVGGGEGRCGRGEGRVVGVWKMWEVCRR